MNKLKKILHIDSNWDVHYILVRERTLMKSSISLEGAVQMLKQVEFDLILSEPHNQAILTTPQEKDLEKLKGFPLMTGKGIPVLSNKTTETFSRDHIRFSG